MAPDPSSSGSRGENDAWAHAHNTFAKLSATWSGMQCADGAQQVASSGPATQAGGAGQVPSSCSYAAAMGSTDGSTDGSGGSSAGTPPPSCPVKTDAAGTPLNPLTNMPLALYDTSTTGTTGSSSSSTTQQQQQRSGRLWNLLWRSSSSSTASSSSGGSSSSSSSAAGSTAVAAPSLGTVRQKSSIPMAAPPPGAAAPQVPHHQKGVEGEGVWMYPSESMFYNAMKRKGWQPSEGDMGTVVAIHNTVNERAWSEVLVWESRHSSGCAAGPRLKRFQGKPSELSPKARALNLLGFAPPFDRHDWIVDRCGKEVRYIIDFYSAPAPPGHPPAMFLDVRPALDSMEAAWDRVAMQATWVLSGRWLG